MRFRLQSGRCKSSRWEMTAHSPASCGLASRPRPPAGGRRPDPRGGEEVVCTPCVRARSTGTSCASPTELARPPGTSGVATMGGCLDRRSQRSAAGAEWQASPHASGWPILKPSHRLVAHRRHQRDGGQSRWSRMSGVGGIGEQVSGMLPSRIPAMASSRLGPNVVTRTSISRAYSTLGPGRKWVAC